MLQYPVTIQLTKREVELIDAALHRRVDNETHTPRPDVEMENAMLVVHLREQVREQDLKR